MLLRVFHSHLFTLTDLFFAITLSFYYNSDLCATRANLYCALRAQCVASSTPPEEKVSLLFHHIVPLLEYPPFLLGSPPATHVFRCLPALSRTIFCALLFLKYPIILLKQTRKSSSSRADRGPWCLTSLVKFGHFKFILNCVLKRSIDQLHS